MEKFNEAPDASGTNNANNIIPHDAGRALPHEIAMSNSNGNSVDSGKAAQQKTGAPQDGVEKPSRFKQLLDKTGLDFMTIAMMFKGSVGPIVAIAAYQSTGFDDVYSTLGYLVAIISVLGLPIMPRGKFLQNTMLNVPTACLSAAVNLLALYCITQARKHTTPPGHPLEGYNAAASAVAGLWLFFQTYAINAVRAARPQLQFPCIVYSIFVNVALTYGTQFPTMTYSISFIERLLEAFLTGFGIAFGVHFVIFPVTSRTVVFKQMTGYMQLLNGMVKSATATIASFETVEPSSVSEAGVEEESAVSRRTSKKQKQAPTLGLFDTPAAAKLKETMEKLIDLHTKLNGDVTPAKREFAVGKLESHDISELWKHLRMIFVPVLGLTSVLKILNARAQEYGWNNTDGTPDQEERKHDQLESVHFLMKELHGPFATMSANLDGAFQHIMLTLEFVKPPGKKKETDVEKAGDAEPAPGTPDFPESYKKKIDHFYLSKQQTLTEWCREHNIELPDGFFDKNVEHPPHFGLGDEEKRERHQRQLFMILYLEYLLWRIGTGVLDLMMWVEKRKSEGAFKHRKLIFPGSKTLYKWIKSVWSVEDLSKEDSYTVDMDSGSAESMYLGQQFEKTKDPEHLPPTDGFQRFGDRVRGIPRFFRSDASSFGLRVAAATMSLGVVCYLRASQTFFLHNRLLWAIIMVAISMSRTAGQSTFNYLLRVFGTLVAMIGAYIVWYIVDGHTAGVIVFLWVWVFCAHWVVLKKPRLVVVGILSIVTSILIIGYELQVKRIGKAKSESNGQPAYTIYILAPYRLATVSGGIFVAWIWTIFPFPISEGTELRKDIGALLGLSGMFQIIIHETIGNRVRGVGGDEKIKGTHNYHLHKARTNVFSKMMLLQNSLLTNSSFSKFQVRVGGKFPHEEYTAIIDCLRRILLYSSLGSYTSTTFQHPDNNDPPRSKWSSDFRQLLSNVNVSSHRVASVLSLLSSSMRNGTPLPPYLETLEPLAFAKKLEALDPDILSMRHIAEPEYSAFAVLQVVSVNLTETIGELTSHVKNLVGELDFSFRPANANASATTLMDSTTDDQLASDDDKKAKRS